jgi:hypothetical protein
LIPFSEEHLADEKDGQHQESREQRRYHRLQLATPRGVAIDKKTNDDNHGERDDKRSESQHARRAWREMNGRAEQKDNDGERRSCADEAGNQRGDQK